MKKAILFTLCISIIISLFSITAFAQNGIAELSEGSSGFTLTVSQPVNGDGYQLWMGKTGVTEDELASISDEEDFMEKVGYADFAMAKNEEAVVFNVDLSSSVNYGAYTIRFIHSGTDDILEDEYFTYKYADPTLKLRASQAFMNVSDSQSFVLALNTFSSGSNEFISAEEIGIFADADMAETAGEMFAVVRDIKFSDGGEFKTASDIISCAKASLILKALIEGDSNYVSDNRELFGEFIIDYIPQNDSMENSIKIISSGKQYVQCASDMATLLGFAKAYGADADEKSMDVFDKLKVKIEGISNLETVLKWSKALAGFVGANRADIEKTITDNALLFGIDTSSSAHYGVSLAKVATMFNMTDALSIYGTEAFNSYYNSIALSLAGSRSSSQTPVGNVNNNKNNNSNSMGGITSYSSSSSVSQSVPVAPGVAVQPKLTFNDIGDVVWAHGYLETLLKKGVINGVTDTEFMPNRPVTREEFVKMLVVAFDISSDNNMNIEFSDVSVSMWSYPYIEAAYLSGIVKGNGSGRFGTTDIITRQDAAVMLSRVIGGKGGSELLFTDANDISDYALEAVENMTSRGIINGTGTGKFKPLESATRVEAAVMIARALEGGIAQ